MFTVHYYQLGYKYSYQFTRDQAEDEILSFGYPISRTGIKNLSDDHIGKILKEIYSF